MLKLFIFILAAPLVSGFITKIKNNLRLKIGPGVLQPYFNLGKYYGKGEVVSGTASWIFKATPFIVFSSALAAAYLVLNKGDLIALLFVLGLGRFFLALSALDTGSSFGGMGSSREMFISSLAEPVALLVIFTLSLQFGTTSLSFMNDIRSLSAASAIGAIALFLVITAETSRIPVDNQETHLELTMVHEAMVLEYSGRSLFFIEVASYIKQLVWFFILAGIVFPAWGAAGFMSIIGIAIIASAVALLEISVAKMRLFRVTDYLGFAFVLAVISAVCVIAGV